MRAIDRKLLRDLLHLRGPATAIVAVMACGVATFVMSLSMLDSLVETIDAYYERNRFADVFARLERAPRALADRVAAIPGVERVQARIVERATLEMPRLDAPASAQVVSLADRPGDGLNRPYLRAGRRPEIGAEREVLVGERFAAAHGLRPGSALRAVLDGRRETLRVVGIALSPEHVYFIPPGSVLPEPERYGLLWMSRADMEAAFDMEGAFNDLALDLAPGASEPEVIAAVDRLVGRYGGVGAHGRDEQASHQFVENEMHELRGMALFVPIVFLAVAAFLLNLVLARLVAAQREQIAALKALGYTGLEIARHYAGFATLITVVAVVVGTAFGAWMGGGLARLYAEFFDFPSFGFVLRPRVVALGFLVSGGAAAIGVAHAVRAATSLPPAEAMRPKAPPSFRPTVLERLGVHRLLAPSTRMIVRELERRPLKTGASVLGIALAGAVMVVGTFSVDAIDFLMEFQFERVQRHDVDVVLADRTDRSVAATLAHLPGVRRVESYRMVAARLVNGHRSRRVAVTGLEQADGLRALLEFSGRQVVLPDEGIVLSAQLAELLDLRRGDEVTLEVLDGRRPTLALPVADLVDDFSGLSAYMRLDALGRALQEPDAVGGAYLAVDSDRTSALHAALREAPRVVAVNVKEATVRSFRETIARQVGIMRPFLLGFAVVIAFGVVYNAARISLSERGRDLATLRVLGMTRREVASIQLVELAVVTGIAVPIGLVLGAGLAWWISEATASELFRIPFVIAPDTFAQAGLVVVGSAVVSGLVVRRRVESLDLVSVLKSRE